MSSQFLHLKTQFARALLQPNMEYPSSGLTSSTPSRISLSSSPKSEYSMDGTHSQAIMSVEVMWCSQCVKTVETIIRRFNDGTSRVSMMDISVNGMVSLGTT